MHRQKIKSWLHIGHQSNVKHDYFLESLIENIFQTAYDAIVVLQDSKIIEYNYQALEMSGTQPNDLLGETPMDMSPELQLDGQTSLQKGTE